jgi:hypothetical protein
MISWGNPPKRNDMYNPTDLSERLFRTLLSAAGDKREEFFLTGAEARQILEALDADWMPKITKGTDPDSCISQFRAALRDKFGVNIQVKKGTVLQHGKRYDIVSVTVQDLDILSEEVLYFAQQSGLTKYFREDYAPPGVLVIYVSKRAHS